MSEIMNEKIDWTDYPYLGLGEKPIHNQNSHKHISEEQLEKLFY